MMENYTGEEMKIGTAIMLTESHMKKGSGRMRVAAAIMEGLR